MFEDIPSLLVGSFFSLSFDIRKKVGDFSRLYKLASTHKYFSEENFSDVFMGWKEEGLFFLFNTKAEITKIELFLDTRNIKNHYITKFCHHFLILPKQEDVIEETKFREDNMHPLAKREYFDLKVQKKRSLYAIELFIDRKALYGYGPEKFDRLGFTYKISREHLDPQHFSVSSSECRIEKNPYFWAEGIFKK